MDGPDQTAGMVHQRNREGKASTLLTGHVRLLGGRVLRGRAKSYIGVSRSLCDNTSNPRHNRRDALEAERGLLLYDRF